MSESDVICPNCDCQGVYGKHCRHCGHYLVNVIPVPVIVLAGKRDSGATCHRCGSVGTPGRPCEHCGQLLPIAGLIPETPHPFQHPKGRVYQRFRCQQCGTIHADRPRTCSCGSDDFHSVLLEPSEVCAKTGEHEFVCQHCGAVPAAHPATS